MQMILKTVPVSCLALAIATGSAAAGEAIDIGSRLELFVDQFLIDSMQGTALELHAPIPAESVLELSKPWEGRFCGYTTVIKDGELYRMYYRGLPMSGKDGSDNETTCCAESKDGIHWTKPNLGIYEVHGTRENNVIIANHAPLSHNFSPFLDTRPGVAAEERFKALSGTGSSGLVAWVSADGRHWSKLREEPVLTDGAFDSQNLAFWSESEGCYVCYFRIFTDGFRSVARAVSPDFVNWTQEGEMDWGDTPREHIYTNETLAYFRAPHIYIAVAARFMPGRRVISAERMAEMGGDAGYSGDCSDAVLITSRGGTKYDRTFMESFIRPGLGYENWTSRTNYPVYGIVPTDDGEMSLYVNRNYGQDTAYVQRLTLRTDGFVSVNAPYAGGEMLTNPITFAGKQLVVNYATSAAGSIWVEILDAADTPIEGFSQADADEIIGDEIERTVSWKGNTDVRALAGTTIRLRFVMKDADLYSIRFR